MIDIKEAPRRNPYMYYYDSADYCRGLKEGERREREHWERMKAIEKEWKPKFHIQTIKFAVTILLSLLAIGFSLLSLFNRGNL